MANHTLRYGVIACGLSAVLAVVLLVVPAVSVATTKSSAPVIHEPFKNPPRCTGKPGSRTTRQLIVCAERDILAGDRKIDKLNRQIFALLSGKASRHDFIVGHNAWLRYRRTYCLSASDAFRGGSEAAVTALDCASDANTVHIEDLRQFHLDLEGD